MGSYEDVYCFGLFAFIIVKPLNVLVQTVFFPIQVTKPVKDIIFAPTGTQKNTTVDPELFLIPTCKSVILKAMFNAEMELQCPHLLVQQNQQLSGQLMIPQLRLSLQLQLHLPLMSVGTKKLCVTTLIGLIIDVG